MVSGKGLGKRHTEPRASRAQDLCKRAEPVSGRLALEPADPTEPVPTEPEILSSYARAVLGLGKPPPIELDASVDRLRNMCASRGLLSNGSKVELAQRLRDWASAGGFSVSEMSSSPRKLDDSSKAGLHERLAAWAAQRPDAEVPSKKDTMAKPGSRNNAKPKPKKKEKSRKQKIPSLVPPADGVRKRRRRRVDKQALARLYSDLYYKMPRPVT